MFYDTCERNSFGISVDGPDGVGKTTFLKYWREAFPLVRVVSPIPKRLDVGSCYCILGSYADELFLGRERTDVLIDELFRFIGTICSATLRKHFETLAFATFNKTAFANAVRDAASHANLTTLFDRSYVSFYVYQDQSPETLKFGNLYDANVILVADKDVVRSRLDKRSKKNAVTFREKRDATNWELFDVIDARFREYAEQSDVGIPVDVSEEITREFVAKVANDVMGTINARRFTKWIPDLSCRRSFYFKVNEI